MPLIKINSNVELSLPETERLLKGIAELAASHLNKPERYIMACLEKSVMVMSGTAKPAAFVDLRSIGKLSPTVNKNLSAGICDLLRGRGGIDPERIFITFTDVAGTHWGWNRETFG